MQKALKNNAFFSSLSLRRPMAPGGQGNITVLMDQEEDRLDFYKKLAIISKKQEVSPLQIKVFHQPCLLYETVELLYAYVNQIPPEQLTADGPYCIPAQETASLMAEACAGLDPTDSALLHFFSAHGENRDPRQNLCLAFVMVYTFIDLQSLDMAEQMRRMSATWEQLRRGPYRIHQMNHHALIITPLSDGAPPSLAQQLKQLPIREDFFADLLETFSDFSYQLSRLHALIQPVALRLASLMAPHIEKAAPLAEAWEQLLLQHGVEAMLESHGATHLEQPLDRATFVLQYLNCQRGEGQILPDSNQLVMLLGAALKPSLTPAWLEGDPTDETLTAIRLLGDRGRSRIIRALQHQAMSMQELATHLNANPGSVFRNLNSLADTHLLHKEVRDGRYYYRSNISYIRTIFSRMLDYFDQDGPDA